MSSLRIQTWSLGQMAAACDGELSSPTIGTPSIRAVSTDTRTVKGGELFVALVGERFDGHDFLEEAREKGAAAFLISRQEEAIAELRVPTILVEDTQVALARLGHAIWREAKEEGLHTVAVTGSNGKTTTKELLATLWGTQGEVWATPGNFNNHIGVPLTLCGLPLTCDHFICEMGANHVGEIEKLIELAPGEERIITSIGLAHLEGFGSVDGIRRGKREIFQEAVRSDAAIVPFSERENLVEAEFPGDVLTFGDEDGASIQILSSRTRREGARRVQEVKVKVDSQVLTLSLPLLGVHNATNLAAAMATMVHRGERLSESTLNAALASLELPEGRFRHRSIGSLEILDDAYNANPSSMRASFRSFLDWCLGNSRVAVIGEMFEIGEDALAEHQALAEWLAEEDTLRGVLFFGEYAEPMKERYLTLRPSVEVVATSEHQEVAAWLRSRGPAEVFLKGSRGSQLEVALKLLEEEAKR